jgi:HK97 family phage portal protein
VTKSLSAVLGRAARKPSASLGHTLNEWIGRQIGLGDGGFWGQFLGGESSSGKNVTVDNAMQLSAVWSCVRIISTSVAGLPMGVYRREADGGRKDARDFGLYDIVHTSPNDDMTAFQFWQAMVAAMLLRGNAFAEVLRIGNRVVALDFLLPSRVDLELDADGRITYWYRPKKGARRQIQRSDMLHIPAFSLDGRVGLSAIRYGADVFGAAMSADDAANGTFKNGLLPAVAFKVDRVLKPEQREEFRDYVKQVSGALNAGRSPVLEQGITPESIGINPVDAQLLESRGYSVEEVCRWFGVPPWMVGKTDAGSNWGTGLEQQMIAFLTFSISSITNQIQQCVNKRLLTPADRVSYYAEFSLEAFLKADTAGRSAWYSQMTQNGIMTRDECRVKENLPRHGGNAGVLTVQTNLTPIDKLGESTDGQAAQTALKSWLGHKE